MDDDLILRLATRLNPTAPEETAADLRKAPAFQGSLQWLERLFESADALPLPELPDQVYAAMLDSFESRVDAEAGARSPSPERAVLIHDSRESGRLAGIRGAATSNGDECARL